MFEKTRISVELEMRILDRRMNFVFGEMSCFGIYSFVKMSYTEFCHIGQKFRIN